MADARGPYEFGAYVLRTTCRWSRAVSCPCACVRSSTMRVQLVGRRKASRGGISCEPARPTRPTTRCRVRRPRVRMSTSRHDPSGSGSDGLGRSCSYQSPPSRRWKREIVGGEGCDASPVSSAGAATPAYGRRSKRGGRRCAGRLWRPRRGTRALEAVGAASSSAHTRTVRSQPGQLHVAAAWAIGPDRRHRFVPVLGGPGSHAPHPAYCSAAPRPLRVRTHHFRDVRR